MVKFNVLNRKKFVHPHTLTDTCLEKPPKFTTETPPTGINGTMDSLSNKNNQVERDSVPPIIHLSRLCYVKLHSSVAFPL